MDLNYEDLSDKEILSLIKQKDSDAMEYMLKKYSGIVKKEIRTVYLIGAETEDLAQEGMIGLFKAIRDYEDSKGAAFNTFATLCVRNQIKTAIKASNRKKHTPLNTYISIYTEGDEKESNLAIDLEAVDDSSSPEAMVIANEQFVSLEKRIDKELSPFEKKVLKLYLEGLSYADIGAELDKKEKSVNNALQRIRGKLSR